MWATQCHKQLPFRDSLHTTNQHGDDLGMVFGIGFTTLSRGNNGVMNI
jgi:hypothetical protein